MSFRTRSKTNICGGRLPARLRRRIGRALHWILTFTLWAGPGAGSAGGGAQVPGADTPAATLFSGERAMSHLEFQCSLGPRPPGSPELASLRRAIAAHADSLALPFASLCFTRQDPYGAGQLEICNLVISAGPDRGPRLWLGAHYDTRPRCDRDPDPTLRPLPLLGANDGASGVAVLLHLAELLAASPPPRRVLLIFFDAEDYGREGDLAAYCLGSGHLAQRWRDFGSPLAGEPPEGLVLLDMVGKTGLRIPMEGYSLQVAESWTRAVFDRALALDLAAFAPEPGPAVYDDHIAFLRAGIPAVNLIDFRFPQWHTAADTPAVCSAASLAQVGRLVTDLAYRPIPVR